jgi:D-inositol-3-phosphate glycosyltransferase
LKPLAIISMHASPTADLGSGENGGMNVYVRAVCEELSRRGVPTEIFTRRSSARAGRVRLAEHSWVTQLPAGPADEIEKAALLDLLPDFTEAVLAEQRRRGVEYSLIHSHYWLSGWAAARLRDSWRIPWFHTAHTLARVKNEQAAEGAMPEPDHRIAVEQAIVRDADRLIASSLTEADDLARLYGADRAQVSVVSPGVDLELFGPRPTEGLRRKFGLGKDRVVMFAGRLERLKGAETLLRAFALLSQRLLPGEPLALVIIGEDSHNGAEESQAEGGERARLERLAGQLGILPQVRFVGSVNHKALARYLSLAEICVVPSYSESFGLVALEAEACGTPVVAARVGGLPSVVKDGLTGYTIVGHDPSQYAERMATLLQDEELRRCFSRRGRLLASQFTWQDTVDRLLVEYQRPQVERLEPAATG